MSEQTLEKFYQKISYNFNNPRLLEEALTHPSLITEKKFNYQRLEFLGDKVLSLIISDFLMKKHPKENEGALSKRQASLVSGEMLSKIALEISLNNFIRLSPGEEKLGGRNNKRNLENALEALVGAIYLDSNFENATKFVLHFWHDFLQENIDPPKDPISELQELVQLKTKLLPIYETFKSSGLQHEPIFTTKLKIPNEDLEFESSGKSKKESQKDAAKLALEYFLKK